MAEGTRMPPALLKYWVHGPGAVRVRWGQPGDFDRCVKALTKETKGELSERVIKGTCSNLHQAATGARPGHAPSEQTGKS